MNIGLEKASTELIQKGLCTKIKVAVKNWKTNLRRLEILEKSSKKPTIEIG